MTCFTRVDLLKDMINLFRGIRFRSMDLFNVCEMQFLLGACAETLETLRVYPTDPRGERLSLKGVKALANDLAARSSFRDFDLSRNKSLRTLETTARSIKDAMCDGPPDIAPNFLKHVLLTVASSACLEVTVFYRNYDFQGIRSWYGSNLLPFISNMSQDERAKEVLWQCKRLEVLREVHKARNFQLVLCAHVWNRVVEYSVGVLEEAVAAEKVDGGIGDIFSESLVTCIPQGSLHDRQEEGLAAASPTNWTPL
jgi:hypothetical protein